MLVQTTWRARPINPEQASRLLETWGKLEAKLAERTDMERVSWYIAADGSSGSEVIKSHDSDAAAQFALETSLALGEFLELESKQVLDLDTAMPAILSGLEYGKG
jgi:hypothetical protein